MADYTKLIPKIKMWEGGFSNHPNDKGGATNSGVTIATYRSVFGKNKTVQDLKNMSEEEWNYIFKTRYWDKWKADEIENQSIAEFLVDWTWCSGVYGIKYPQQVLGVAADGIVGKKTISAVNNYYDKKTLFDKLWNRRKKHFDDIVRRNPSQRVFYKGWTRRLNSYKYK